jgi:hypothetical protein
LEVFRPHNLCKFRGYMGSSLKRERPPQEEEFKERFFGTKLAYDLHTHCFPYYSKEKAETELTSFYL